MPCPDGKAWTYQNSPLFSYFLLDATNAETRGRLIGLDSDSLKLLEDVAERRYELSEVKQLDRQGDSLKNGVIVGAPVGPGMGALLRGFSDCSNDQKSQSILENCDTTHSKDTPPQ